MRLTPFLASLTLLAAPVFAADPFALLPKLPTQVDAVDCEKVGKAYNQIADLKSKREEAVSDERDALQPKVEAEMQAWTAQMMQGGDMMAMSQQLVEYNTQISAGTAGQLETDPDCVALTTKNQSSNLVQAIAPDVKAARVALVKSLDGKTGADYTAAFAPQVANYATSLNGILGKASQKAVSCAANREKRSTIKSTQLSPSMQKMIALNADAELQTLTIAQTLANDQIALCMSLDGLRDYANADTLLTAAWYEKPVGSRMGFTSRAKVAMSSSNPVKDAVQQAKDSAVGKAVDKAFGSLFGR